MARKLKVFASKSEQPALAGYGRVIASYDAFAILEPARGKAPELARRFPCEDITSQYELVIAGKRVRPPDKESSRAARRTRAPSRARHHYLVQYVGPVKRQWLTRTSALGGQLQELYQHFTYVVRADAGTIDAIGKLPFVRWVGHLPHVARVSAALRDRASAAPKPPRTRLRPRVYTVQVFDPKLLGSIATSAKQLGFEVLTRSPAARTLIVRGREPSSKRGTSITALSQVHGVKFIRARPVRRTSNDVAVGFMGAHRVGRGPSGLSGRGEIIAVCDTGLDTGDPSTLHRDFRGRLLAIKSYPVNQEFSADVYNAGSDDGPADLDSGHGTHVAGSALGAGTESAGVTRRPVRGLAYRAKLVFQAVEQEMRWRPHVPSRFRERYVLSGIPTDLTELFDYAYRKGARVHSNSWGGGGAGDYDEQSDQLDRFVWKHKDFCVLVAAGNDGTDHDADGVIDLKSVTPPATAKNCITVGASENERPEVDFETYGGWWPQDYPSAPQKDDPMANDAEQVAAFSSRGPTDDRRIKPDLVAPGTFILSARSTMIAENNVGWRAFPPSGMYFFMGGTSMATPLLAGAAALAREYFRKKRRAKSPSAALIKAALIAGARRLPGTKPSILADNHQGYGRVDLDAVLKTGMRFKDVSAGLETGQMLELGVTVRSRTPRLRAVLAYTDYPGPALVNNLNLILTAPTGRKYTSAGGSSRGAIALDSVNNVEVVEVRSPRPGSWRIDVVASSTPEGPQDFALVLLGAAREIQPAVSGRTNRQGVAAMAKKRSGKRPASKASSKKRVVKKGVAKKGTAKKRAAKKRVARKRELVEPTPGDRRFVRRDDQGRFDEVDDAGRSIAQDRRKKAKKKAKRGQGDRGDR